MVHCTNHFAHVPPTDHGKEILRVFAKQPVQIEISINTSTFAEASLPSHLKLNFVFRTKAIFPLMKHITTLGAGGDDTAAYLYWDEDRDLDKLIIVNNKKASVAIKVECLDKVVREIEIGSYETFGIFVEDWMKEEKIWVTVTYHGNVSGCIGYKWSIGGLYG